MFQDHQGFVVEEHLLEVTGIDEVVCEVLAVSDVVNGERVEVSKRRHVVVSVTINTATDQRYFQLT